MDGWWKSALQAAEKAKSVAKTVSQKGMEFAESTAEEAGKRLKDLGLHEKAPSAEELEFFGINPEFQEFIRTLNYSTFRDFPSEHLVPLQQGQEPGEGAGPVKLNPWQERHAKLVCLTVKEVNELRYVLCPRYMTDEHFWHVYFTLVKKYLPEKAFTWTDQYKFPAAAAAADSGDSGDLLTSLGSQLKQLGSKLQQGGRAMGGSGGNAVELSSMGGAGAAPLAASGSRSSMAAAGGVAGGAAAAGAAAAAAGPAQHAGMLETDPDLEAYLQVAISEREGGSQEGEGYDVADEDLDLDSYINELSAEVEAAEGEEEDTKKD